MLPPEAGVPTIRRELTYGATRGEIVVGKRLGILLQEWDESGGLDTARLEEKLASRGSGTAALPMIGKVVAARLHGGLEVETTLDPQLQPFLHDHQFEDSAAPAGCHGDGGFCGTGQCSGARL